MAGRWNSRGRLAVYVSASISLAYLERLAHMDSENPEEELHLFEIEIPEEWIERPAIGQLAAGWDARPPGPPSRTFGDEWLERSALPALLLPSVIVPQECNALINPMCPEFDLAWAKAPPFSNTIPG